VLTITGIAAGGAGVGRIADGRVAFVQRTAPGDTVEVEVLEEKPRWLRARILRVIEPAAHRRTPPCPWYDRCGGCTLQHVAYPVQLQAKSQIVHDALRRIGHIDIEPPEIVPSTTEFHYRNRLTFTITRLGSRRVVAGFHEIDEPDRLVDIAGDCLLAEPALADVWRLLRANWGENANRLPAGETLRLTLQSTSGGGVTLLVEGGFGDGRADDLLATVPGLVTVWRRAIDGSIHCLAGAQVVQEHQGAEVIELTGGIFLQVNRSMAALMEDYLADRAGDVASLRVIDAYCGVGIHARRLAARGARVTGIEVDARAVAEARRACGSAADFLENRVEDVIGGVLPADLVIVNPPRAGLHGRVVEALKTKPPARLLYVSCDPATLARDVSRLDPRFRIRSMRGFDLFAQTSHVEVVVELACATS
jgi:23S rRNA (uracil1939-C5)-methyltransferase